MLACLDIAACLAWFVAGSYYPLGTTGTMPRVYEGKEEQLKIKKLKNRTILYRIKTQI
jgi:hypothetical protein